VNGHLFWYVARASGIVSWALLSLSVLWGVVLSTRLLGKRATPAWLLDVHRFFGGAAVAFVGVHIAGLVADSYVHFGITELLVPLASAWKPVAVAWGVVALYLLLAVEITSLLRKRIPAKLWRRVHMASFGLWVMATVHMLTAGTDAHNPVLQWTTFGLALSVVFATVVRVLSPKPDKPARPARPRIPEPLPNLG